MTAKAMLFRYTNILIVALNIKQIIMLKHISQTLNYMYFKISKAILKINSIIIKNKLWYNRQNGC